MSWNDYYRRRDVIDAVLATTGTIEDAFTQVPDAAAVFADTDELLLALDHKWTRALTAHIGLALSDTERDRVDAVSAAWRRAVADNPTLRRLLDERRVLREAIGEFFIIIEPPLRARVKNEMSRAAAPEFF